MLLKNFIVIKNSKKMLLKHFSVKNINPQNMIQGKTRI